LQVLALSGNNINAIADGAFPKSLQELYGKRMFLVALLLSH
jgi:Leucine-rich repeat (LRR) protein